MSYDPDERRETPLALQLKERIRREGPITVAAYMQACLHDPEHGYYRSRTAIGAEGDFITAPEISQVFGELLGLWSAVVWQQMGSPASLHLIELGPGRGTLMRDALRATRSVPGFADAMTVHLVETNATLEQVQRTTLSGTPREPQWHRDLTTLPGPPAILIANEFLDTFPVTQSLRTSNGSTARTVGLDTRGELAFLPGDNGLATGAIVETQDLSVLSALKDRMHAGPFAGLFIDYGHVDTSAGDTLQAVHRHRAEHPLCSPGEADLTVQVDFAHVREVWGPSTCDGPITQAEFLGALGIVERASRLMAANPVKAAAIETGIARLMAPNGMGTRFKVLGVRSADLPSLPGF